MSVFPGPANAVTYAQFNLLGRWPRLLTVAGLYFLAIGGSIWLTTLSVSNFHARDLEGWASAILGLQVFGLLVWGSFRVESAVRSDVTSRMIESHRLMPVPPLGSILGYLFGAPMMVYALAVINFFLGGICCQACGLSVEQWALANGILLFFALFVYSMITQFALFARGGFLLTLIAGVILAANAGQELVAVPSLAVLVTPILSRSSVFVGLFAPAMGSSRDYQTAYLIAMAGQGIIAGIAIRVAMRRYQSADAIGISAKLGLMLLTVWVVMAVADFFFPELFAFGRSSRYASHDDELVQIICGIASSMLLAMLPIASAARAARHHGSHRMLIWTPVATVAIVSMLLVDIPARVHAAYATIQTFVVIVAFVAGIGCLFSADYRKSRSGWVAVSIWVAVTWVGPIIVDAIYRGMSNDNSDATVITAFSPPGALVLIWNNSEVVVRTGLFGQVLLVLIPVAVLIYSRKSKKPARVTAVVA